MSKNKPNNPTAIQNVAISFIGIEKRFDIEIPYPTNIKTKYVAK